MPRITNRKASMILLVMLLTTPFMLMSALAQADGRLMEFEDGLDYTVMVIEVVKDSPEEFCIKVDDDPVTYCYEQEEQ